MFPRSDKDIIALDLSQSWTADLVVGVSSPVTDGNAIIKNPNLWYNAMQNEIGVYGGVYSEVTYRVSASVFTLGTNGAVSNLTERYTKGDGSSFDKMTRIGYGYSTFSPKAFYVLKGFVDSDTDPDYSSGLSLQDPGLLVYDFASATWRNETKDFREYGGGIQYIPLFGKEGVLISWGGGPLEQQATQEETSDVIHIYDIASRTWHQKVATGNLPLVRSLACSIAVGKPNSGSYEM